MRQIGVITDPEQARVFAGYLLTQGIKSRLDSSADGTVVWIHDEDQLEAAKRELGEFQAEPGAARFKAAAEKARELEKQARKREEEYRRNMIQVRSRWSGGAAQRRPLTVALVVASVLATFLTDFGSKPTVVYRALTLNRVVVDSATGNVYPERGLGAVREGQVWRLFTPVLIHLGVLHLVFNMYWLYLLGGIVEEHRSRLLYIALALAAGVLTVAGQFYFDGIAFGMSGVGFAFFGYIWMQSKFDPWSGLYIDPNTVFMFLFWFVLCFTPFVGNVANAAHTIGLVFGAACGYAPVLWRKLGGKR
jgi:GlpG protein